MRYLVAVAIYDTNDNDRTRYTIATIESLRKTTDPSKTRVFLIDNDSCKPTKDYLKTIKDKNFRVITNKENLGTAEAINLAWVFRESGEYCVKCDNDVVFHDNNWLDKMGMCFEQDDKLGILGLKRKDLPNSPSHEMYTTTLYMLDKKDNNQPWCVVEVCDDIIGTCLMFNPKLLDEIGYLYQPGIYGYDDVLACERSLLSDYVNAFLPSVHIDHIDDGKNEYIKVKQRLAGEHMPTINQIIKEYRAGTKSIYYNPFE